MKRFLCSLLAVFSLGLYALALAAELANDHQSSLVKSVDGYAARLSEVALKIWSAPEVGYQETKTSALLQAELKNAGFKIDAGVAHGVRRPRWQRRWTGDRAPRRDRRLAGHVASRGART